MCFPLGPLALCGLADRDEFELADTVDVIELAIPERRLAAPLHQHRLACDVQSPSGGPDDLRTSAAHVVKSRPAEIDDPLARPDDLKRARDAQGLVAVAHAALSED